MIQLLSHATVFVCPSIYEPQGIVNLEAMACEAAVVATDTGGIPEVVEDGVTGLLVPFATRDDGSGDPLDPHGFVAGIAERVNALLADPDARAGWAGPGARERSSSSRGPPSPSRRPRSTGGSAREARSPGTSAVRLRTAPIASRMSRICSWICLVRAKSAVWRSSCSARSPRASRSSVPTFDVDRPRSVGPRVELGEQARRRRRSSGVAVDEVRAQARGASRRGSAPA